MARPQGEGKVTDGIGECTQGRVKCGRVPGWAGRMLYPVETWGHGYRIIPGSRWGPDYPASFKPTPSQAYPPIEDVFPALYRARTEPKGSRKGAGRVVPQVAGTGKQPRSGRKGSNARTTDAGQVCRRFNVTILGGDGIGLYGNGFPIPLQCATGPANRWCGDDRTRVCRTAPYAAARRSQG